MEEVTAKASELKHLEEELELLKEAADMAFDIHHPVEFYLAKFNEQVDVRKHHLGELKSEWYYLCQHICMYAFGFSSVTNYFSQEVVRKRLEEKKKSLEESLYANNPDAQEKLQKLKNLELEKESILSAVQKREEELSKLSMDLAKQPKLESRRSYVERVQEITKNSRKQEADIEQILKDTRELQLESNSIQERLHRTYAVVDEMVFREAKKDAVGKQAYRLLTSIHETFEQIREKILGNDRIRREAAEHEKKQMAMGSRSLNVEKLQADLDAIMRENEYLEKCLHDK
ncbi:coiled-coil domain-containing protein 22 isoform X2 [Prunus yedoensis var. nudiflora]|uniref:Coiled-coil domain-containing protein 22 isoform X2 n=1 Tax=Prunus yedoensis var. nudiflora TaxID=2094558 RepID=A0A314ZS88_PRUYE|nr:coiled-coil domain-containing protein 22 isoform X2 [Prunus yedoensis var. nudiflora]